MALSKKQAWKLANSNFVLWLLSSVVLSLGTWGYSVWRDHVAAIEAESRNEGDLLLEASARLSQSAHLFHKEYAKSMLEWRSGVDQSSLEGFLDQVSGLDPSEHPIIGAVVPAFKDRSLYSILFELKSIRDKKLRSYEEGGAIVVKHKHVAPPSTSNETQAEKAQRQKDEDAIVFYRVFQIASAPRTPGSGMTIGEIAIAEPDWNWSDVEAAGDHVILHKAANRDVHVTVAFEMTPPAAIRQLAEERFRLQKAIEYLTYRTIDPRKIAMPDQFIYSFNKIFEMDLFRKYGFNGLD